MRCSAFHEGDTPTVIDCPFDSSSIITNPDPNIKTSLLRYMLFQIENSITPVAVLEN